jgi:cytochrome b
MKQLIWDLPTRFCHWGLTVAIVLAFALPQVARRGSVLFGLHIVCGVVAGLLLAWRLVWGFTGSRHARFRALRFGPGQVWSYLRSAAQGRGTYYPGHNPGSALAIWAMFALTVLTLVSGVLANSSVRLWRGIHELAPNLLLAVVVLHVAGVTVATLRHKENYLAAMFSGLKTGPPDEAIPHSHPLAAAVMTAWVVLGSFYFIAGFNLTTGVFSPPGTGISVRLTESERRRPPRDSGGAKPPGPEADQAQKPM